MRKLLFFSASLLLCAATTALAQSRRAVYDSLLVGDRITPAVSSVMMPKSFTEVILHSSLITANAFFTSEKRMSGAGRRDSFFFNTLQVTHGISGSGRFNVGVDLSYRIGRRDALAGSSALKVFGNSSDDLIAYERAFTSVAVRARYVPFAKVPNLVIQHAFHIPISAGSEKSAFLFDGRYAFNSQLLYNHLLGRKMFLFGQLDLLVRLKDDTQQADYTVPVNIFATYLASKHLFPFVQLGMSNSWLPNITASSYSYGAGLQYQITTMYNITFFYNDIFAGKNTYQWKTFNLGLRAVF
jgi:opacity protein-like surface antigen